MAKDVHDQCEDELNGLIEIQSLDEIPKFRSEDEEDEFWATHSVAPHLFRGRGFRPGSALERIYERRRQAEAINKGRGDS